MKTPISTQLNEEQTKALEYYAANRGVPPDMALAELVSHSLGVDLGMGWCSIAQSALDTKLWLWTERLRREREEVTNEGQRTH